MQFRRSLDDIKKDQRTEIKRYLNLSTDQKLDEQIKFRSTELEVSPTDPKLDQHIKSWIKRLKLDQ